MQNIIVGRYKQFEIDGVKSAGYEWQGWIEPDDRTWIAFVALDGRPVFFLNRDPATGATISP